MQRLLLILMAYPANGLMFLEPSQTWLSPTKRLLMALPARLGGLGITNPSLHSDREFSASLKVISPLKKHILSQDYDYPYETLFEQNLLRKILGLKGKSDMVFVYIKLLLLIPWP